MNPNDPNVMLLEMVAEQLGTQLLHDMVFVGGAVAGLLVTDPGSPPIRPTEDVDLIVRALALVDYHRVEQALERRGFARDMSAEAPICRWRVREVAVDVMPTLDHILGFSNRWYPLALDTAEIASLPSGTEIRLVRAPVFVATKLEAFAGRGNNDYLFSHDLGDVLAIVDGRDELIDECALSGDELRTYLRERIANLLSNSGFLEALPGHLSGDAASQARLPDLRSKLHQITRLS